MSVSSAWEGLGQCFSALAAKHDFTLWGYSEIHPPKGVDERTLRRTWLTQGLEIRTDYTSLTLQGSEKLTPQEFLQVNRLLWLAWVAGTLLHTNADRHELHWFLHVFRESHHQVERGDNQARLLRVAECSGIVAEQLSRIARSPQVFVPPPPGSWRAPFETLQRTFQTFTFQSFEFRLEFHGHSSRQYLFKPWLDRLQVDSLRRGKNLMIASSGEYSIAIEDDHKHFLELASQAGKCLPPFLKPSMNLYPSESWHLPTARNPEPLMDWLVFLNAAQPDSFQPCIDPSDEGAKLAAWNGGNPFLSSTLAIDLFIRIYIAGTVPLFSKRLVQICPWFTHEDRPAVSAAIEVAFQTVERNSVVTHFQKEVETASGKTEENFPSTTNHQSPGSASDNHQKVDDKPELAEASTSRATDTKQAEQPLISLPKGITWEQVQIHVDAETLRIKVNEQNWSLHFSDCGFADGRKRSDNPRPTQLWGLLQLLSRRRELKAIATKSIDWRKKVSDLRAILRHITGLNGDPIPMDEDEDGTYRPQFQITGVCVVLNIPPNLSWEMITLYETQNDEIRVIFDDESITGTSLSNAAISSLETTHPVPVADLVLPRNSEGFLRRLLRGERITEDRANRDMLELVKILKRFLPVEDEPLYWQARMWRPKFDAKSECK
jgi:hypothetical protein